MKSLKTIIFFTGIFFIATMPFHVSAQSDSTDSRVYMVVPQMPTFPGDLDNFMGDHLHYPQSAIDRNISGTVNVTFVITKTGLVAGVNVLLGVSPDLDSEAVRVVRSMPPWNPGKKDGVAVNVQYNLPVYFVLNNHSNPSKEPEALAPWDTVYHLRDGLYVDPYLGYGLGGPSSDNPSNTTITAGSNFKFGAGVTYMFPSNIGISAGLQVQQFNFNYTYSNVASQNNYDVIGTSTKSTSNDTTVYAGYAATVKYSFLYGQIPILCRYITSQENKIGFYAEAGLVVNFLVSSQISGNTTLTAYELNQPAHANFYNYSSTEVNTQNVSMPSQNPARLTTAAHAGIGALIPCTAKISVILAFSYDMGIMNAGDGSKDEVNYGTSKFYFYGAGNYGSFNALLGEVKLLIKMSGETHTARY